MSVQAIQFTQATGNQQDWKYLVNIEGNAVVLWNAQMVPYHFRLAGAMTNFALLTAAALAVGKDPITLSLGTGTEVIARSVKGGMNVKTQVTSPADNDNAMIIPASTTALTVPNTTASLPMFRARLALTQITELVFGAGLDENITSPIPPATAGDGASFYFDPGAEVVTGLPAAALPNWILTEKVAGVDTYLDSGVPVLAGVDYELVIKIGLDLKPLYYIAGGLVGTGASAMTSAAVLNPIVGVQINSAAPAGQKDFDIRYLAVDRSIG